MYAANTGETLTHTYLLDATGLRLLANDAAHPPSDLNQWAQSVRTNAIEIMEGDKSGLPPFAYSDTHY